MPEFKLVSEFSPLGDQPQAITRLTDSLKSGKPYQTLLGVTGSGKTFTVANVVANLNRPTLVISHNKTLGAQLYREFKGFFPENAVEYFVSYYDYYQPEAYVPATDTYIEKDASINEEIDKLRLSATSSLLSRRDCLIVASVSCIYGLGSPEEYEGAMIFLERAKKLGRDELLQRLLAIQYERNDIEFTRGKFRVRGDTVEIYPAYKDEALRVEFFSDEIEKISCFHPISGKTITLPAKTALYPAKHFVASPPTLKEAVKSIREELNAQLNKLRAENKLVEAQRLETRTNYDLEMLKEVGYCTGIENYARHFAGRPPGSRGWCLIDYFPKGFLTIIDESHVTIPQLRGMYEGDHARKETLVEYGFRLPSCLDNRPLRFEEFKKITGQTIFASATPTPYELKLSGEPVEQIIRPTGLIEPEIIVKPTTGEIDDLINEVRKRAKRKERVLVTTLTKRMAEDLASYLEEMGLRVRYLHSEIGVIERMEILKSLRQGEFDCLTGVNLLREGLDLPEVSLVAILDADKEGFLRSQVSLIQLAGRAARNVNSRIIMYAGRLSNAMKAAIKESNRRREKQSEYNRAHKITPRSIKKAVSDYLQVCEDARRIVEKAAGEDFEEHERRSLIAELEREMELAARNLEFERAAILRDQAKKLKKFPARPGSLLRKGSKRDKLR